MLRLRTIGMPQTGRRRREVTNTLVDWNKTIMLTIDPLQVFPGQRQEDRIDLSITRLYEIDLKRQIKLLHTFIRLLGRKEGRKCFI